MRITAPITTPVFNDVTDYETVPRGGGGRGGGGSGGRGGEGGGTVLTVGRPKSDWCQQLLHRGVSLSTTVSSILVAFNQKLVVFNYQFKYHFSAVLVAVKELSAIFNLTF